MNNAIVKRSVVLSEHKTSVSLEDDFWRALKDIAHEKKITLNALVALIDAERSGNNLSSAIRLYVLNHYRSRR